MNGARSVGNRNAAFDVLQGIVRPSPPTTLALGAGQVLSFCNTEAMSLHLAEISLMVTPGAHAVVLMDQVGWFTPESSSCSPTSTSSPYRPNAPN